MQKLDKLYRFDVEIIVNANKLKYLMKIIYIYDNIFKI